MGYKATTGATPQLPIPRASILAWASALTRYLKGTRLIFGNAFTVNPGPNGTLVDYLPPGGFDSFKVYRASATAISIRGGYAQTQTGTLTAVADVATVAVSADTAVFARYDLGLAGTSSPGWEVVSGSIIQTAAALPAYNARYRVVPIAAATWDGTSSAISGIVQHHTGTIPCPDPTAQGIITTWTGSIATIPHGWALCDGANSTRDLSKKFIYGANTTDNAVAATGGAADHTHNSGTLDFSHSHGFDTVVEVQTSVGGPEVNQGPTNDAFPDSVSITTESNMPPYLALAYIQHL